MSPDEWAAEAHRIRAGGGSIVDIARALRAYGESGGRKINAAAAFGSHHGWLVRQKLELLSWTEGGVTDGELMAFVSSWFGPAEP
ncbi:hypothetical protein [Streptomyces sp. NPDC021020]|uniref:hypothetical protein n=1 Tax=Streptomyces sp. NPDC021020 TaxID=3365109 RepID=UPI00378852AD